MSGMRGGGGVGFAVRTMVREANPAAGISSTIHMRRKRRIIAVRVGYHYSMRRIWGIFKFTLMVLSGVLALGVLVLWFRSYSGSDIATWTRAWREGEGARQRWVQLVSKRGRVYLDV